MRISRPRFDKPRLLPSRVMIQAMEPSMETPGLRWDCEGFFGYCYVLLQLIELNDKSQTVAYSSKDDRLK